MKRPALPSTNPEGHLQLGLSLQDAYRFELAQTLATRGVVSAPNAAIGAPYSIGGVQQSAPVTAEVGETRPPAARTEAQVESQPQSEPEWQPEKEDRP